MNGLTEQHIGIFLFQFFLILALARGLGEVFRYFKQPPLTAEILVGILLGPTIFGRFFPAAHAAVFPLDPVQQQMLETIGWLGIFFFLLEVGLEIDFTAAWRQRGEALTIALTGLVVPLVVVFAACFFLPDHYLVDPSKRVLFASFMAVVMSVSAMAVAARALHDLKVSKTDLGFLILSALSVNDIISWLVFTVVMSFAFQAAPNMTMVGLTFVVAILFTVLCLTVGRLMTNTVIRHIRDWQFPEPASSLTFIAILGALCGAVTQRIGVHALLGFFLAGVMAGSARALPERTRQVIAQMVFAIFVPVFFVGIGLKVDFLSNFDWFLVFFITGISIAAKFLGAWLGVRFTSVSACSRTAVAVAHTPGGAMEIVVAMIALQYGLISSPMFVGIIASAIISSAILGPWLAYALRKRKEISVIEFFSRRDIVSAMKSSDRESAIRELCAVASEHDDFPDEEVLFNAVWERENIIGTALEEGVAVPHARLSSIDRAVVVFGYSRQGIEWNSPDGKLASYVFLILTPQSEDDLQVQTLAVIAKTMNESFARESFSRAALRHELWDAVHRIFTSSRIFRRRRRHVRKRSRS